MAGRGLLMAWLAEGPTCQADESPHDPSASKVLDSGPAHQGVSGHCLVEQSCFS